jgi:hypothetical protein
MDSVKAIRVLVYARLKRLGNDTCIVEYLKKHMDVSRTLGLCRAPDRTTIGRWWKRYMRLLASTSIKTVDMLQTYRTDKNSHR